MKPRDKLYKVWTPFVKRGSPFWRIRRRWYILMYKLYGPPPQPKDDKM